MQTPQTIDGEALRAMFAAGTRWLARHVEAVNAINVYPVPDGDTGTNMYRTMRATIDEAARSNGAHAGAALRAMARGALMGARGNSGVILSQIIRGMADRVEERSAFDGRDLALALRGATESAYGAVSHPVEGTMLTVIRESADAVGDGPTDVIETLSRAVEEAKHSVERTPTLLPVLADAGVVDAGAQGLYLILEGALRQLRGEEPGGEEPAEELGAVSQSWLEEEHASAAGYGYCTEFIIVGEDIDEGELRARMSPLGESVLVAGVDGLLRVHLHTEDPGAALTVCAGLGRLRDVKVDDMEAQHDDAFRTERVPGRAAPAVGIVAVAAGAGWIEAFRGLGAAAVVRGGQTMNPSAEELVKAIRDCRSASVIVLPNNKNVILSAQQAAQLAEVPTRIVPTRSMPQGIAAMLAHNAELSIDENVAVMEAATNVVHTVDVTHAVRDTTIGAVAVRAGQAIAIIDGELRIATDDPIEAAVLAIAEIPDGSLLTVYWGEGASAEAADALGDRVRALKPDAEVEVVAGGQPHYPYIISSE